MRPGLSSTLLTLLLAAGPTAALLRLPVTTALVLALSPSGAQAQNSNVLVSNIDLDTSILFSSKLATAFTTGNHSRGYAVSSVDVSLSLRRNASGGKVVLTIRAGGATPGAVVATLSSPASLKEGVNTFTAPPGTVLAPDTTYFLVAQPIYNVSLNLTRDNGQSGESKWSIADNSTRFRYGDLRQPRQTPLSMSFAIKGILMPAQVVTITSGSAVTEGTAAGFTVTRSFDSAAALTVKLTVADAANADFVASGNEGSKTVIIPANQDSATYTVPTTADTTDEPNGRVTVTVAQGTGYNPGTTSKATVTVNDDDATTTTLALFPGRGQTIESPSDIGKEAGRFSVTLNRKLYTGESLAIPFQFSGGTVSKDFYLQPVTRQSGVTYNAAASTVTFTGTASGSGDKQHFWFVAEDDADKDHESVTVTIPSSSSGSPPILTATGLDGGATGSGSASFTVIDDEASPGIIITLTSDDDVVWERGTRKQRTKHFTVALATRPTADVTVTIADPTESTRVSIDGSEPGTKYTGFPVSATFTSTNWHIPQKFSMRFNGTNAERRRDEPTRSHNLFTAPPHPRTAITTSPAPRSGSPSSTATPPP